MAGGAEGVETEPSGPHPGLSHSTRLLKSVTLHGHRLSYVDVGRGSAVLLVHGLLGSHQTWAPQLDRPLARRRLIAPDLLGHGASDKPNGDYSLGAHAGILRDLLASLKIENATVIGHSFGGGIAMEMAYLFPGLVRRLVLISSGGLGPELSMALRAATLPGSELVLPLLASRWLRGAVEGVGKGLSHLGLPQPSPSALEAWRGIGTVADPATRNAFLATSRSVIDIGGQKVNAREFFPDLARVPTLLVWGAADRFIPPTHAENVRAELPGAQIEMFPGAGHFPHLDQPALFERVLEEFIRVRR